ncbi:malto-oligosyltrehalose synthase [Brevundimonas sp.]|jgi:(1->4)-alpha-D-glucan 1-alpha-D-glucosylmutase|uniref:malto-oligosyltrehalose synthase n=1 Tax=Brevundimonas sp. TaxID=1871086 RepID=UPI0037C12F91
MTPRATYRLQFHAGFTFADGAALAPYLAELGISHVYASPIATARTGSIHGYDVVDPTAINPALGGETGFRTMAATLRAQGLGLILDIVPNHVAVGGADNAWWLDVLERGPGSPYAAFFDIDWSNDDPALDGRLLAPFLGAPYGQALASGDLVLEQDEDTHCLSVMAYGTHRFPIRSEDYPQVLAEVGAKDLWDVRLNGLQVRFDGRDPQGRARLHALLERQYYRLAWWRTAGDQINWRRFFDISELAGLRIEAPAVFDAVHALPLRLYAEGLIDGLRVDHVDGLADPAAYTRKLRAALESAAPARPSGLDRDAYLIVEKILGPHERLDPDWATDGTTGYDFMNAAAKALHDPSGADPLGDLWAEISGRSACFEDEEGPARAEILSRSFAAQAQAAAAAFERLARSDLRTRDLTARSFSRAISSAIQVFPTYRTYGTGEDAPASDSPVREGVQAAAKARLGAADHAALDFVMSALAGEHEAQPSLTRDAVRRFQQLSAPVSAKAVEDTAFYRYGRLLSRNDVGFDPQRLGEGPEGLHGWVAASGRHPQTLLATATHDHKRGEDGRMRLAVLSEIPDLWRTEVVSWIDAVESRSGLTQGDVYQLCQALVGAWPVDGLPSSEARTDFAERIGTWMIKALREAKLRSSWVAPDLAYEDQARRLIDEVLGDETLSGRIDAFVTQIAPAAVRKSLVQTGLKLTLPGVPDFYQGAELWDYSLVDPDNRRPVDFDRRATLLAQAPDLENWRDGSAKLMLIRDLLMLRRDRPYLFSGSVYRPAIVEGRSADEVVAFERIAETGGRLVVWADLRGSRSAIARGAADEAEQWRHCFIVLEDGTRLPGADHSGASAFAWTYLPGASPTGI